MSAAFYTLISSLLQGGNDTVSTTLLLAANLFFFRRYCNNIEVLNTNPAAACQKKSTLLLKRQNPFIQLLTEGKKLREKAEECSEDEYLKRLKEIRMMNAKERRHLYEKYGRARSSVARIDNLNLDSNRNHDTVVTWADFSDFFYHHHQSGRRTANSDTFIINDLKRANSIDDDKDEFDDDNDVTMVPMVRFFAKSKKTLSSKATSQESTDFKRLFRRRSSGMLETLRNFICLGPQQ